MALQNATLAGLSWQPYAGTTGDLVAPVAVDLITFASVTVTPRGGALNAAGSQVIEADGVVVDNLQGASDVMVTVGPVSDFVPRFQKAVIPLFSSSAPVVFTGAGVQPRAYFYKGAFRGSQTGLNAFASQQAADVASITGGTTDAYLNTITWQINLKLPNGSNLDNLQTSGFYDVLNPANAGAALAAGTWQIDCRVYSSSPIYVYQLARNLLSSDTQVWERRNVGGVWTVWRDIGRPASGQVKFKQLSSTVCRLSPFFGGKLYVNGNIEQVPSPGVDFANTLTAVAGGAAMSVSTLYYAYVYMSAPGVMAAEWSTTIFTLDLRGNPVKNGDGSRTLVGMAYTNGSAQFQDDASFRGVATYFNRQWLNLYYSQPSASTGSTSPIGAGGFLCLSWGEDSLRASAVGSTYNTKQYGINYIYLAINGAQKNATQPAQSALDNITNPVSSYLETITGIGPANIGSFISVNANTGAWTFVMEGASLQ